MHKESIRLLEFHERHIALVEDLTKREMLDILELADSFLDNRFRAIKQKRYKISKYTHEELVEAIVKMLRDKDLRVQYYTNVLTRTHSIKTVYDQLIWEQESIDAKTLPFTVNERVYSYSATPLGKKEMRFVLLKSVFYESAYAFIPKRVKI